MSPQQDKVMPTVLLVEDEQSYRRLLHSVLEDHGYEVLSAWNGKDALVVCEQHRGPIDLLLTDVLLNGMNGGELAQRLGRLYPRMAVIYYSGDPYDPRVRPLADDPNKIFVSKPFPTELLLDTVRRTLAAAAGRADSKSA